MITKNPASRTLIIHTVGNLDALTADHYRGELRSLISEGYRFLIFDLEETPYMNSSGLGLLVEFYNTVRRSQGTIRLINCSKQVRWLLEQTHIESLFTSQDMSTDTSAPMAGEPLPDDPAPAVPAFDPLHNLMSNEIHILALINDFILRALGQDDPRVIGRLLLDGVLKALHADHGALMMLDDTGEHLELVHLQRKNATGISPVITRIPLATDRLETRILHHGEATWHHLSDDHEADVSIFKKMDFEWMLAAPVTGASRIFGLLAIEAASDTKDLFQAAKPLIMTFANIGGLAIDKASMVKTNNTKDEALSSQLRQSAHYRHALDTASHLVAMGTITTGLTHLLNNQMVPLLGYTQLLRQSLDLNEDAARKVDCIFDSVTRINKTLDKVLHLTQLNRPVFEDIDVRQLIQTVIDLLQTKIEEAGIDVQLNMPHSMSVIKGNPDLLKQAFFAILHRSIITQTHETTGHSWIRVITSLSDNKPAGTRGLAPSWIMTSSSIRSPPSRRSRPATSSITIFPAASFAAITAA